MAVSIKPADVLAIRTTGRPAWWIRFGAAIHNQPDLSNHIAVAHHYDANGVLWCIEGRPGGVGWVDASKYIKSSYLLTNAEQPKTDAQRLAVCETMKALLGTAYDWQAIVADGMADLGFTVPGWHPDWNGTVPAHVVCSSAADYAYYKNGLACPKGGRLVQPSDWDAFILNKSWIITR